MEEQSKSKHQIVKQEQQSLTVAQRKAELISSYIEKFAAIDNRAATPMLYQIYIESLSRFELRQLEKGLKTALEEGVTRWPWPAELAGIIEEEIG